jgi:hypothetical protein
MPRNSSLLFGIRTRLGKFFGRKAFDFRILPIFAHFFQRVCFQCSLNDYFFLTYFSTIYSFEVCKAKALYDFSSLRSR